MSSTESSTPANSLVAPYSRVKPCSACGHLDSTDGMTDGAFGAVQSMIHTENHLARTFRLAQNRLADKITMFAGSMKFVYIHLVWFAVWVSLNVGLAGVGWEFDRFPFGLLTMLVSLEAIFLATFVMISQNRQAARSDLRSEIDFENNVRGEVWSVHIGHSLGIDPEHVETIVQQALESAKARLSDAE